MVYRVRARGLMAMFVIVLFVCGGWLAVPTGAQAPDVPQVGQPPVGLPQTGPDVPALGLDVTEVVVFDDERWSFTEGVRSRTIDVPLDYDRVVLEVTIRPDGDPWDRLFAVAIGSVEVLHGTTPRTEMTVEKDLTEYASQLPAGGTQDVRLYLGTWVGALRSDVTLHFYHDEPTVVLTPSADAVVPAYLWNWHCGNDLSTTVTFPDEAPTAATVQLFTSGHGGEEFWYQFSASPRQFDVRVDDVTVMTVVAMPYVYALLGFDPDPGGVTHQAMWWTAQQGLDKAGVHSGTGEIPPYRVQVNEEALHLLSGERTVDIVTTYTKCRWQTSVSFLLEA